MASWRTTIALDVVADAELIARLVELQSERRASDVVRVALREHFELQPTLQDVMDTLHHLEQLIQALPTNGIALVQAAQPVVDNLDAATAGLNRMLSRFKGDT